MQITTRNRKELSDYFVKNAIPTQKNFEELIQGMLNFRDDGIAKLPNDPLSIEAAGEDGQKKVLHFYGKLTDTDPEWALSLNPREVPTNAATAKPGFSIGNAQGTSRLFIDRASGKVGLGTINPRGGLDVPRGDLWAGQSVNISAASDGTNAGMVNIYNETSKKFWHVPIRPGEADKLIFFRNDGSGSPSQWMAVLKLGMDGLVETAGVIRTGGMAIGPWPANPAYAFVGTTALNQSVPGNYALLQGSTGEQGRTFLNSPNGISLRINNAEIANLTNGGLEMERGAIVPVVGNNTTSGIQFPSNPGGGGADVAFIRYYVVSGETTKFVIGIDNDADDQLILWQMGGERLVISNGIVRVDRLQLGTKWLLSGVGDAALNDDWLRLFGPTSNTYFGGLAANKLWTSNGQVQGSDRALKENIAPLGDSLSRVCKLQGVRFDWKAPESRGEKAIGLIAQDVEEVFPEAVAMGPEGMKGVDYGRLIAPLVECIKEQQQQIEELRRQVAALGQHRTSAPPPPAG